MKYPGKKYILVKSGDAVILQYRFLNAVIMQNGNNLPGHFNLF